MGELLGLRIADSGDGGVLFSEVLLVDVDELGETYDDARRIKVVIEGLRFAQEFRREKEVELLAFQFRLVEELESVLDVKRTSVTDRDGTLDDHDSIGVVGDDEVDDFFDVRGVEVVLDGIVVGGCCNDNIVGLAIGGRAVKCCREVTALAFLAEGWQNLGEVTLDVFVLYGADAAVNLFHLFGNDINSDDFVMLGQQCGDGKAYVACSGYSNLNILKFTHFYFN